MSSVQFDVKDLHKGREVIYSCFSRLLLNIPTEKVLKELYLLRPFLKEMGSETEDKILMAGIKGINKWFSEREALKGKALADFDLETEQAFTRLFCLTDSAPLSESVYLFPGKMTMQEPERKVSALYSENGFAMGCDSNEPKDHISYELMFMSFLALQAYEALAANDDDEADGAIATSLNFIEDHLQKWLGDFLKAALLISPKPNLYISAIYFIVGYVGSDREFLKAWLEAFDEDDETEAS